MKNLLILGLLALFLFSVSAALSLWLNQTKPTDTAEKDKDKDKDKEKDKDKDKKKDGPKETVEQKPPIVPKDTGPSASDSGALLRDREARLVFRASQMELVIRDLQVQREATDATLSKVMSELKNVGTETAKLDALAKDLKSKLLTTEVEEQKNIDKLAIMYEAMSPESAAAQLKVLVDTGKLDMAAKILAQMKQRNAARVFEVLEPSIAGQLIIRIQNLRPPMPPPKTP